MTRPVAKEQALTGLSALIVQTSALAARYPLTDLGTHEFVLAFAERFAFIRLQDIWRPYRFLKQMEGAPPIELGTAGFKHAVLDDKNPARHYAAFVFIGYWLPNWLGYGILWGWELAGFVRYGFEWSYPDVRSGYVGLFHGRLIRQYNHTILPALMARDLAPSGPWNRLSLNGRDVAEPRRARHRTVKRK